MEKFEEIKPFEDFGDARFYPVSKEAKENAGVNHLGRYHSIEDALDLSEDFMNSTARLEKPYKGYDIYKLPNDYYSSNPRISTMSFKTREALQDYLDRKNPEEHKYGKYKNPGDTEYSIYKDVDENGEEYDLEAPDAYKKARKAGERSEAMDLFGIEKPEKPNVAKTALENYRLHSRIPSQADFEKEFVKSVGREPSEEEQTYIDEFYKGSGLER